MIKQWKNYCIILSNILKGTAFLRRGVTNYGFFCANGMSEMLMPNGDGDVLME